MGVFGQVCTLASDLGVDHVDLALMAGIAESAPSVLGTRERRGEGSAIGDTAIKLADTFVVSLDWMRHGKGPRYNPMMESGKRDLRKWAFDSETATWTPRERLIAVRERLRETVPSLSDEVWAAYVWFLPRVRGGSATIRLTGWQQCVEGNISPGDRQLEAAAYFTGLPFGWYKTDEIAWLAELEGPDSDHLAYFLNKHNMTVDDVMNLIDQDKDMALLIALMRTKGITPLEAARILNRIPVTQ